MSEENSNLIENDMLPNEQDTSEQILKPVLEEEKSTIKEEDFASIFSDPIQHIDRLPRAKKKNHILGLIAIVVAAAILGCSVFLVNKFWLIQEDEEEEDTTITVLDRSVDDFTNVSIKNSTGEFEFYSEKVVEEVESSEDSSSDGSSDASSTEETVTITWYVTGQDRDDFSSDSIETILEVAASVTAERLIDNKTQEECGLDNPQYVVKVTDPQKGDYTLKVGEGDDTYVYATTSVEDKIYLCSVDEFASLDFELLDLAQTEGITAMPVTDDMSDYTDDDGALESFTKLTVYSKLIDNTLVIRPNTDEYSSYFPYMLEANNKTYANDDTVSAIFTLFQSGISASGVYALDTNSSSLEKFGLDSPDLILTLNVAGHTLTYKVAKVDDSYCAVISDYSTKIAKISSSSISMLDYTSDDYCNSTAMLVALKDLTNYKVVTDDVTYSFDVKYDDSEEAEENDTTYTISINGEAIDTENFQNFYSDFLMCFSYSDYDVGDVDVEASATIYFTFESGKEMTVECFRSSATKYLVKIDGVANGRITSVNFNKFLKLVKKVYNGEEIED